MFDAAPSFRGKQPGPKPHALSSSHSSFPTREKSRGLSVIANRAWVAKDALGKLSAKIRLAHNPLHCECALQEALWELKLDPDSVDEIACHTSVQEEYVGKPLIQALDSGVSFCSVHHKTTDVAMLVTMFGWFAMVITYVVYYVRQNQEDARRHLEYLKSLPSTPMSKDPTSSAP